VFNSILCYSLAARACLPEHGGPHGQFSLSFDGVEHVRDLSQALLTEWGIMEDDSDSGHDCWLGSAEEYDRPLLAYAEEWPSGWFARRVYDD